MKKKCIETLKLFRYFKPLVILDNNNILAYHSMKLFIINIDNNSYERVGVFNGGIIEYIVSKFRLLTRVMRLEPRSCIPIDNSGNILISFCKRLWVANVKNREITEVYRFRKGMNHCQTLCNHNDSIYFGEYMLNPAKHEIHIYRYDKKNSFVQKVFTYKKGEINHIHQIIWDNYRKRYWIFAGDNGDASGIWYTDDDFRNLKVFLRGSQQYRACVAYVTKDELIYATDTPYEQNYIIKINLATKEILKHKKINGPGIYGISNRTHFFWATSIEPDLENVSGIRAWLTNRLAKGIEKKEVQLIAMNKQSEIGRAHV